MKTVIFDLDGTLADLTHRLHHVKNGNRRWDQFFEECDKDVVIKPIKNLFQIIVDHYSICILSGRSETVREKTEHWLRENGLDEYAKLLMRPAGDYRKDYIVKSEMLDKLIAEGHEIAFVIDDRPSVVKMWRERGVTCLQCAEWEEGRGINKISKGLLTLLIGPSGAGKPQWLLGGREEYSIHPSYMISSDQLREDLCGDFKDQSKNEQVFKTLYSVVKARIDNGLPAVIDATNIRRADRLKGVELAEGGKVRYIVIDRPMAEKKRDGGWRNELGFDLLAKHQQTFDSQLKDILRGDGLSNVEVIDLRKK